MKATLRYLQKTRNFGIIFRKITDKDGIQATSAPQPLRACADAYWANDQKDRRSFTGRYFTWKGRPIGGFPKSKTQ